VAYFYRSQSELGQYVIVAQVSPILLDHADLLNALLSYKTADAYTHLINISGITSSHAIHLYILYSLRARLKRFLHIFAAAKI
jgi:hypothetical protein